MSANGAAPRRALPARRQCELKDSTSRYTAATRRARLAGGRLGGARWSAHRCAGYRRSAGDVCATGARVGSCPGRLGEAARTIGSVRQAPPLFCRSVPARKTRFRQNCASGRTGPGPSPGRHRSEFRSSPYLISQDQSAQVERWYRSRLARAMRPRSSGPCRSAPRNAFSPTRPRNF